MHHMALQLAPVLAAEKSKVPFYVAGGLLVAWALVLSLALGLRRPDFPGNQAGQRTVIAISSVLVLAAASTAVLTSGSSPTAKAAISPLPVAPNPSVPAVAAPAPAPSSTSQAPATTSAAPAPAPAPAATTPGASTSLKLAADPGGLLAFDSKLLSAKAGAVTVAFANASPVEHNLTIALGTAVLAATPTFTGGSRTLTLKLKPGTYTFYCSVPGHRQAGMEGTLKVS
ncbi:MAG TPA: plastocyanin/azurin family copper-binding protein [Solirubrobacteraceae bacterium]|jgi:plastocyanin|nr:plastocyanin/azurin family copper-binding protein [Solirubrobacteraceae bacterium]